MTNERSCKYGIKKSGACKKKPGAKCKEKSPRCYNKAKKVMSASSKKSSKKSSRKSTRKSSRKSSSKKPSAWIVHVKDYSKQHGISYKEALSQAKSTYNK